MDDDENLPPTQPLDEPTPAEGAPAADKPKKAKPRLAFMPFRAKALCNECGDWWLDCVFAGDFRLFDNLLPDLEFKLSCFDCGFPL